ncbi:MAG: permease-like cell division protein FtsX [bacterium]
MSVLTAVVIAVSLAICAIFVLIAQQLNSDLEDFRSKMIVEVFIDPALNTTDALQLIDNHIKPTQDITSLKTISKEDALAEYTKTSGEDVERLLGYNPLPASARLTIHELTSEKASRVRALFLKIAGVKEVLYDRATLRSLEKRSETLSLVAFSLGGGLILISLIIVISTIRMAIQSRRNTIKTMLLLGARRSTVVLPYILEGGFSGFVGGLFSASVIVVLFAFIESGIKGDLLITSSINEHYILLSANVVFGITIGMIGSLLASWRGTRVA